MDVFKVVQRRSIVFPLAMVAAIAMVLISEASYWRSARSLNETAATGAARTTIQGLRQGLYGQGQLELGRQQVLALPLEMVRTDKPQPYVQLLVNGQVVHQNVTLGRRGHIGKDDATVWVEVKGIDKGAQVLSSRAGLMREGLRLNIVSAPAPATPTKP